MYKNLPKVFVNPINKDLKNNKDYSYSNNKEVRTSDINVYQRVNEIFSNPHHVYKSKVHITTIDNSFDTIIVGKTNNYLLTLNGSKININDILDITRL